MESAGGVLLSVASYGHLRLLIDQKIGNLKDTTHDLVFKGCVESGTAESALVKTVSAVLRRADVTLPHRRHLAPLQGQAGERVLDIKVHPRVAQMNRMKRPAVAKPLVAVKRSPCNSHTQVDPRGRHRPCVHRSEARFR